MPTSYTDQFFVMDPGNPPPAGTSLTVVKMTFTDQDDNGWISPDGGDSANGQDITAVWVNDKITVIMNGVEVTITGVTFYLADGTAVFTPTDGTILYNAVLVRARGVNRSTRVAVSQFGPPCFVAGTRVLTPQGLQPIDLLQAGDLVLTMDQGPQPLRWVGRRRVLAQGKHAPVLFTAGSIGNDRDLWVSPQHRVLLTGWRAELLSGYDEVLVPAKDLVNGTTIRQVPRAHVDYMHLLFDRHQLITAEGAVSESFFPGDTILTGDPLLLRELLALFPDLLDPAVSPHWQTARCVAQGAEARVLAAAA